MARISFRSPVTLVADQPAPDVNEKAKTKTSELFSSYGVEMKADGELEISDYRDMMRRDGQVKAAATLKILARLSSGFDIKPASDDPLDVEIAEFIKDQFNSMDGTVSGFLKRAMLSMVYGLSVHEIVYRYIDDGPWSGKYGLKALKWKKPENFRVDIDDFGNLMSRSQKRGYNDWVKLDPTYFVIWAWNHEGDYLGQSDLRPAYRWFKSKDLVDRIWNIYLEKYATPTPVGKHPPGADKTEKKEMLDWLTGLHAKSGAIMPNNWAVEFLEATREGGSYEDKIAYCDRMIARSILLPTLLLDEGSSGAYALGQQHADNFTWVLNALGEECAEEIIEEQLIKPLVAFNFGTVEYPKFEWRPFSKVDLGNMATAFGSLIDKGIVDNDEPFIREQMNLPPREKPEDGGSEPGGTTGTKTTPEAPEKPAFAASVTLRESSHHRKFQYKEIQARLDTMERDSVDIIEGVIRASLTGLKKTLKDKRILENRDLAAVDKLRLTGIGDIRSTLTRTFGDALHWGVFDAIGELVRGGADAGNPFDKSTLPDAMKVNLTGSRWEPVSVDYADESIFAEEPATQKDILAAWTKKVPVQRTLLAEYSREAYTVSGVLRDDLLRGSQRIIEKGIRRGASYTQTKEELAAFFEPYTGTDGAVDPGVMNPYRIENIVRTNQAEAYNTGRMNLYRDKAVGDYIVAFEYSAVMDHRTTPFCTDWHGTVLRVDDQRIDQNTPPNHYQCRSVWIPIVRGEMFTLTEDPSSATPSRGFMFGGGCHGN